MNYAVLLRCVVVLGLSLVIAPPASAGPTFISLGMLPGAPHNGSSEARGISADGKVVVGCSGSANGALRAIRWTKAGGMQDLGSLPGGSGHCEAFAISADGHVLVGMFNSALGTQAFRWTAADGMQPLGVLPSTTSSIAYAVSADGAIVCGVSDNRPFRWTAEAGMQQLPTPEGFSQAACVKSMSADGSIMVGHGDYLALSGQHRALLWQHPGNVIDLGEYPGWLISELDAVSADGLTIVGFGYSESSSPPFMWSGPTTAGPFELPLGTSGGRAYATSADGSVIVGAAGAAIRWSEHSGVINLNNDPSAAAALSAGWMLNEVRAVSLDGSVMAGNGLYDGHTRAWLIAPPCADASVDGAVNFIDITAVLASWGAAGPVGDANADGVVSFADITHVLANWGRTCY